MKDGESVSVIVPSYNSARFVCDAVESALQQTYKNLEIIVVDDGSTDDTARVLDRFRGRIRYLFQSNRGLAGARNAGIREAAGDLIAFLDADDVWLPEKVEKQVASLARHPQAALIHSDLIYWDMSTDQRYTRECGRREFDGDCYKAFLKHNRVLPSTAIVRRECLETAGLFDEALRRLEDYDLWLRLARRYEFVYFDEPLILYRLHESALTRNWLAMREGELFVLRKALEADPDLVQLVGRSKVDDRLFDLLFGLGYAYHERGATAQSRRYLSEALARRPFDVHAWFLYLANLLPSGSVGHLRKLKASVTSSLRRNAVG